MFLLIILLLFLALHNTVVKGDLRKSMEDRSIFDILDDCHISPDNRRKENRTKTQQHRTNMKKPTDNKWHPYSCPKETKTSENENEGNNIVLTPSKDGYYHLPNGKILSKNDVQYLNEPEWLNNRIIDYVVQEIIDIKRLFDKGPYKYIPSDIMTRAMENPKKRIFENHPIVKMSFKKKIIVAPYLHHNKHWCVIIGNTIDQTIEYYDPLDPDKFDNVFNRWLPTSAKYDLKHFKKILKYRNQFVPDNERLYPKEWTLKPACSVDIRKQDDNYNCGIYIIKYIDLQINKTPILPSKCKDCREFFKRKIAQLCSQERRSEQTKLSIRRSTTDRNKSMIRKPIKNPSNEKINKTIIKKPATKTPVRKKPKYQ